MALRLHIDFGFHATKSGFKDTEIAFYFEGASPDDQAVAFMLELFNAAKISVRFNDQPLA
jgi:hypothetical protein